ncbi:MAG: NAD(P)/FAD-dependent oxidoreductase [Myxococcota bacterium]|jgi:cyclohexanone monooxygenase|nr:NAD(P)-binding domain-containing protein [bacterium]MDP6073784.1 NAD(P)/FAD-dependent oxidoreductase [Myxococcota bacterium]MDP6243193.1 NAD(P)/FAD-dependent oxidoreductase [Myxococcota bacterium]MDP7074906.1 NAD(P)/FAD-dependent oxidoreductase [Myxococcota bacterium]MDP7300125.1 NAD(P)/FAD-dependent oxidoreductase [Myxococcota bacterium]
MATEKHDSTRGVPEAEAPGFDAELLRAKYREERDKRLRADANDQYLEVEGEFAHFLDDPYIEPGFEREPLADEVEVAVIGGGFGGILVAARLREAGVEDIRIIDSASDFGGTWYWNRYPGVACDVESYIYLPLLEETGYMPEQKYATGEEILDHSQRIARKYDLYRDVCFQTKVTELRWDEDAVRWIISTNRGDRIKAHYVCNALGVLNRPKLPGIPGIEDFKGHTFHASRWDYAYTGGDADGNLTGLRGKRVGIIGTGATAVQCVPHVGEAAEHLYVFQRTPSSIDVKNNDPTDPEWEKTLKPGWHQNRMDNFQILTGGGYQAEDLVNDGWTEIIRKLLVMFQQADDPDVSPEAVAEKVELADFEKMDQIRARVDSLVEDDATAEALKPYYRQFCKRPCFHNEYLPTFNRANVTLVDTKGKGVERVTEKGVVVDGREYELDCLIYASGFEVGTAYTQRGGYEIYGRGGQALTEKWADGVRTLHGMHTRGFPNCFFIMSITQSGFTVNFTHMLGETGRHLAFIIKRAIDEGVASLEVSEEAEAEWVETILARAHLGDFQQTCTPSYYNNEGQPGELSRQNFFFFGEPMEFMKLLEDCRADGGMKGLELG